MITSLDRRYMLVVERLVASLAVAVVATVEALTGWHLPVAIAGCAAVSTPITWHLIKQYMRRERGLRFGPVGMTVATCVTWLVVGAAFFGLLYFPQAIWVS